MNGVTDDHRVLAARLRSARDTLGLSQYEVAKAMRIGRSSIAEIETGRRRVSALELRMLARIYRRSIDYFLGIEDEPDLEPGFERALGHLEPADQVAVMRFAQFLAAQRAVERLSAPDLLGSG